MSENQNQLERNQSEKPMSFMTLVILTGLIGGIFWSFLAYIGYIFNFHEIHPNIILEPWAAGEWKQRWIGTVISIILIGVLSVAAALIYYATLRRFPSMWVGAGYGLALFVNVFFVLNPIFPGMDPIKHLGRDTMITSACFYILYGVFVGYSISYEESVIKYKEKRESEAKS